VHSVVLFWRDGNCELRRAAASALEMRILKAVIEVTAIDEDSAVGLGLSADSVAACLRDLHGAGVLRGAMRATLSSAPAT
jgi:predicted transcriptional regulator